MEARVATRRRRAKGTSPITEDLQQDSRSCSPVHEAEGQEMEEVSLEKVLVELRDFRRDNKQQLSEIQQDLHKTSNRLDEAEGRIEEVETAMQAASSLLAQLLQRQNNMEAKLIDQEGRARRENIRIYGIPEGAEDNNIEGFIDKLLRDCLDFPQDAQIKIERAHRALGLKPADAQSKPRSIIVKFASYKVKEEVIRRAWQKGQVQYNNDRFYVDHDYPPAIIKKRAEYNQAKKMLKERKINFQTPYPARLRVFYGDETCLYQTAAEATSDMASRVLPVKVIRPSVSSYQRELRLLSSWQVTGEQDAVTPSGTRSQEDNEPRPRFKEKLQEFKRLPPTDKWFPIERI